MITHSANFENLANAPVKQSDVIVARQVLGTSGYSDDLSMIWKSSSILMSVTIDSVGEMLGIVTKKATVKLLGIVSGIAAGDDFQVRLGLYDKNTSAFEYISEGFYVIDTIDYNYDNGSTTITMYDRMWTANKTQYSDVVTSRSITYPISLQGFATYIASLINVTLDPGFSSLPNASFSVVQDLYSTINNTTIQNVIQDIAGATGTTARISDNSLIFSQYAVSNENLDSSTLKTLKIGNTYGPVTSVVFGRVPQNDNIAINSSAPATSIVESVDATTNLLTITSHGMQDGNMVQITSTGSLPSPLVANKSYYVYTNGNANTFALAQTYSNAVAGKNLIDLTTIGSGTITIPSLPLQEIQINNDQIVDNDRQTMLPPIYNKLSGIDWSEVKSDTVGLGWHEVGDVIQFTQGTKTVRAFFSEVHLTLAGSVKETLISTIPKVAAIDYKTAGGVLKSIYDTEIKVDKQNNTITSIVSRQDTIEGEINTNFSQITQDVNAVNITVQKSGGGNLLLNTVGFAQEQTPDNNNVNYPRFSGWTYTGSTNGTTFGNYTVATHGTATSYDSSESQNYGGISGRVIQMSGASYLANPSPIIRMTQRVTVAVGTSLSFGMRVRKALGKGYAKITLQNNNDSFVLNVDNMTNYMWTEISTTDFKTTMPWLDVIIETNAESFMFTDLRLLYGSTLRGWVQSNNEILSANVQFNQDGMRIFDSQHSTETRVAYNRFSTIRRTDGATLFAADDVGVITNDLKINGSTTYIRDGTAVIKQITIPMSNSKAGIAFIRVV